MARHAPDTFSSPATSLPPTTGSPTPVPSAPARVGQIASVANRAAALASLLVGLAVGALLMTALAGPAPERLQQDAELAGLVRSLVFVKGLLLLAALSLVTWRLGRPVALRPLVGYLASLAVSAAALAWMWSLNSIPVAALLFYGGLIGCFVTASRDRSINP